MSHRLDGYMPPQTGASKDGYATTISAQSATGTNSAGGDVVLRTGTGTSHDGYIYMYTGSALRLLSTNSFLALQAPLIDFATTLIAIDGTQINPIIFQIDQPTSGTDGYSLTIRPQNSTASPAHGGNLVLESGDGYNGDGYIRDGYIRMLTGSSRNVLTLEGYNASFFVANGSLDSAKGAIFIANATTAPTTDPTGGGILYVEGGALKYRGPSGTVTTIAPA